MSDKEIRLIKVSIEFNIGIPTIIGFLEKRGYNISKNHHTKISNEVYQVLSNEFKGSKELRNNAKRLTLQKETEFNNLIIKIKSVPQIALDIQTILKQTNSENAEISIEKICEKLKLLDLNFDLVKHTVLFKNYFSKIYTYILKIESHLRSKEKAKIIQWLDKKRAESQARIDKALKGSNTEYKESKKVKEEIKKNYLSSEEYRNKLLTEFIDIQNKAIIFIKHLDTEMNES